MYVFNNISLSSSENVKCFRLKVVGKVKGKVRPITGQEGREAEKRYSSTLSLTSAIDGGVWLTPRPGRINPEKDPVNIV
jgi:hypothetical protein